MEIAKDNSTPEYPHIYFSGEFDCCALALNTQSTWLRFYIGSTLDEYILLSQEDVKALLPYMQTFAENGTLEPSHLQGGDEQSMLALQIMATQKEQEERIKALEELVRDWMNYANDGRCICVDCCSGLHERSDQLLGE